MATVIAALLLPPAIWGAGLLMLACAGDLGSAEARRLLWDLDRRLTQTSFAVHAASECDRVSTDDHEPRAWPGRRQTI
jgi:hypothetical protein